jgi:hypothetical protein
MVATMACNRVHVSRLRCDGGSGADRGVWLNRDWNWLTFFVEDFKPIQTNIEKVTPRLKNIDPYLTAFNRPLTLLLRFLNFLNNRFVLFLIPSVESII